MYRFFHISSRKPNPDKEPLIQDVHECPTPSAPLSPYDHSKPVQMPRAHVVALDVDVENGQSISAVRSPLQVRGVTRTATTQTMTSLSPQDSSVSQGPSSTISQTGENQSTLFKDTCSCLWKAVTCLCSFVLRQFVYIFLLGALLYYLYIYHREYYLSKFMEFYGTDLDMDE